MKDQKGAQGSNGISRRDFLKKTSLAGASLGTAAMFPRLARKALAANRDYILIGQPGAYTGPIAAMTEPSHWVAESAVAAINNQSISQFGRLCRAAFRIHQFDSDGQILTKFLDINATLLVDRSHCGLRYPITWFCHSSNRPRVSPWLSNQDVISIRG